MTRPIIWAAGSFAAIALAATLAGNRLSGFAPARLAAQSRPAVPPAPPSPSREIAAPGNRTVVLQGDWQGHFTAHAAVEGRHVTMMVDTGATLVVLSHEDATAAGIRPAPSDYRLRMSTANGVAAAAPVRIREIRVGEIYVRNVDAVVMPRGLLRTSLLGMSFLRELRGFEIASGRLTLRG